MSRSPSPPVPTHPPPSIPTDLPSAHEKPASNTKRPADAALHPLDAFSFAVLKEAIFGPLGAQLPSIATPLPPQSKLSKTKIIEVFIYKNGCF
jgi:hypothetical protein